MTTTLRPPTTDDTNMANTLLALADMAKIIHHEMTYETTTTLSANNNTRLNVVLQALDNATLTGQPPVIVPKQQTLGLTDDTTQRFKAVAQSTTTEPKQDTTLRQFRGSVVTSTQDTKLSVTAPENKVPNIRLVYSAPTPSNNPPTYRL